MVENREKVLAIDFGERRIGLAVAEGDLAEPLLVLEVKNQDEVLTEIFKICRRWEITKILLGLPCRQAGLPGPQAQKVQHFGERLKEKTGLPLVFWDETLTSQQALEKMIEAGRRQKRRRYLDDVVAAMILQEYLDSR